MINILCNSWRPYLRSSSTALIFSWAVSHHPPHPFVINTGTLSLVIQAIPMFLYQIMWRILLFPNAKLLLWLSITFVLIWFWLLVSSPIWRCPRVHVSSSLSSSSSFLQIVGWIPWLRQRGDGRLSGWSSSCLGISPPRIQEDAVLRKSVRHVLQPQQPPGSLGLPARLTRPGRDQPGVSKRARWSSGSVPPPAHATVSSAAAVVLDITNPKKWDSCE